MAEIITPRQDSDGIVVITLDDPSRPVTTMNSDFIASMEQTLDHLKATSDGMRGIVVTSAKSSFLAGADLRELRTAGPETIAEFGKRARMVNTQLRTLETFGVPLVAAMNGSALGGGLEFALACHHRIAVADQKARYGFPEVNFGLLPGAGGIARAVRLLGIRAALEDWLLEGRSHGPAEAKELGLIDEIVPDAGDLLGAAKDWVEAHQGHRQPWDMPDFAFPGGGPADPALVGVLPALPAVLQKKLKGANYPAPAATLATAVEGAQVDFESAVEIETRHFLALMANPVSKNMIKGGFFDLREVRGRGRSPEGEHQRPVQRVMVVGAGMMGAAIAYVCAEAGIEVTLKDVSLENAEAGKGYAERRVKEAVERGRIAPEEGARVLERIRPSDDPALAADADLAIEAVFEDPVVKAAVFAELEQHLPADSILGSNTSTLPISALGSNLARPDRFLGLHFFSPVDRMPLLEMIRGQQTSPDVNARALAFAHRIRKTPILVDDSRGFFTSRVITTRVSEGIAMLGEGIPAPSIEQASSQAGYPVPVLQLSDELNLKLMRSARNAAIVADERGVGGWGNETGDEVIDRMLDQFDRPGKLEGGGFYEYRDGRRQRLWPGLSGAFGDARPAGDIPLLPDLRDRFLFIEALEAARCLETGVINSVADANVGSLLGIGFPSWTGGALQFIEGYPGGAERFVARALDLAHSYGERFQPPAVVREAAERRTSLSDGIPVAST